MNNLKDGYRKWKVIWSVCSLLTGIPLSRPPPHQLHMLCYLSFAIYCRVYEPLWERKISEFKFFFSLWKWFFFLLNCEQVFFLHILHPSNIRNLMMRKFNEVNRNKQNEKRDEFRTRSVVVLWVLFYVYKNDSWNLFH